MLRYLFSAVAIVVLFFAASHAYAQNRSSGSLDTTEVAVTKRIRELELQVQQLTINATQDVAPNIESTPELPADRLAAKHPNAKLTGFFQLDWGFYSQDEANRATLGDIQDGGGFRRARLAAVGNVTERTSYIMEFDFAQAQPRFVDVWVQFEKTPLGNVRIGRFREPFGMTELTAVRDLPFLERPLLVTSNLFLRQTGIMLSDSDEHERLNWSVSGFQYLSDTFGNVYGDHGGYGLATRFSCLPLDQGERLVHLGFDYSYKDPARDLVQLANFNEFFLGQNPLLGGDSISELPLARVPLFVDTGQIAAQSSQAVNLEAAAARGNMLLQSEVRWATVEDVNGIANTFPGAYLHFRYVLTGETIPYNRSAGVFGRVKPRCPANAMCGDWGAWEIAARMSYIDLNGLNLPGPGRRLTNYTAGLNWYLNNFTKMQFNWIHSDLDDATIGPSTADTVAMRCQLDF